MIKIKIAEIAAKKHDVTSAYQLQNFLGISPSIASRLWKGEFDKIGINTINTLCNRLNCQPSDFLEYVPRPTKEDPLNDRYVTKAERASGVTRISRALGWGNPRSKKPKDEPQTDSILLNNSLLDNVQSNNTESDKIQSTKHTQNVNTTQSASDNIMSFHDTLVELERIGKSKSDSSLRRYLKSGELKGELITGNLWQIKKPDFENFINSNFFKNLK